MESHEPLSHFSSFADCKTFFYLKAMVGGLQVISANPQICELNICQICGPSSTVTFCAFAICGSNLFCDLRILNFRKYMLFNFTNKAYHALIQSTLYDFWTDS
jgi:hypothetical protein